MSFVWNRQSSYIELIQDQVFRLHDHEKEDFEKLSARVRAGDELWGDEEEKLSKIVDRLGL